MPVDAPFLRTLEHVDKGWGDGPASYVQVDGPQDPPWGTSYRLFYRGRLGDRCAWPGMPDGWYRIASGPLTGYRVLYVPYQGIVGADRPLPGYQGFTWRPHRPPPE